MVTQLTALSEFAGHSTGTGELTGLLELKWS